MNSLQNILKEIDTLYQELQTLRPLTKHDEERLWKKFRLEWNYNSNHMEGNTLTYGETELLLMFGKISGDHEAREIDEMRGHDVIVQLVKDYAADKSRDLSESDIRQWNKTILVKPFWKEAITADGQPTRKQIEPGNYKSTPNSVRLANGEIFHYASPEETPIKMHALMEWYKKASNERKVHPVELAALLHYKFVRIHPFDDGNGRAARLLMNYVLLKNDYPPVIIKSADKKNYLFALNKADVGDEDAFVEYISKQLIWSLRLNIEAAKNNIEELNDVDKEIAVWKKEIRESSNRPIKSLEVLKKLFENSIHNLFQIFFKKQQQFDDLFAENEIEVSGDEKKSSIRTVGEITSFYNGIISNYNKNPLSQTDDWDVVYSHRFLKTSPDNVIHTTSQIRIVFFPFQYEIMLINNKSAAKHYYSYFLNETEQTEIVNETVSEVFKNIRSVSQKKNNS